jgi:hypothetical protein
MWFSFSPFSSRSCDRFVYVFFADFSVVFFIPFSRSILQIIPFSEYRSFCVVDASMLANTPFAKDIIAQAVLYKILPISSNNDK